MNEMLINKKKIQKNKETNKNIQKKTSSISKHTLPYLRVKPLSRTTFKNNKSKDNKYTSNIYYNTNQ